MGHIKRSHLSAARCAIPGDTQLTVGSKVLDPLIAQMTSLDLQSRTLSQLRETLLPKLLSGELTVSEAETLTEEVDV